MRLSLEDVVRGTGLFVELVTTLNFIAAMPCFISLCDFRRCSGIMKYALFLSTLLLIALVYFCVF